MPPRKLKKTPEKGAAATATPSGKPSAPSTAAQPTEKQQPRPKPKLKSAAPEPTVPIVTRRSATVRPAAARKSPAAKAQSTKHPADAPSATNDGSAERRNEQNTVLTFDMNKSPADCQTATESEREPEENVDGHDGMFPPSPMHHDSSSQPTGASKERLDEGTAERERKRKEKQPMEPRKRKKAAWRADSRPRSLGPTIRTPPASGGETSDSSGASSSSESEEERVEQPTSYAKYRVELDMELAELMKQFSDPKLAASLKRRQGGLKRYLSGYLVHFDSLDTLQVHEEFADYMDRAGLSWLIDLDTYKVPLILCDEFFTSFKFDITTNLNKTCIEFRLFDEYHRMNLNEWSVRLGLYTVDDIVSGEVEKLERGLPGRHVESDANAAWGYLTGLKQPYHYSRAFGYNIIDPVLRMCHVFLVTNIMGVFTAYSRVPSAVLYFLWCIVRGVKIHLGFWLAYQIRAISRNPHRHFTICQYLGRFVHENFEFGKPSPLSMTPLTPAPRLFDLEFLQDAGLISMTGGTPRFYSPGDTPTSMISKGVSSGGHINEGMEKRLKKIEKKMAKLKEADEHAARELKETREAHAQGLKDLKADLGKLMEHVSLLARLQLPTEVSVPEVVAAEVSVPVVAAEVSVPEVVAEEVLMPVTAESAQASTPVPETVTEPEEAPAPPPPAKSARTPRTRRGR